MEEYSPQERQYRIITDVTQENNLKNSSFANERLLMPTTPQKSSKTRLPRLLFPINPTTLLAAAESAISDQL
jgi:hypothetical protein